jgi:hypothetical protein
MSISPVNQRSKVTSVKFQFPESQTVPKTIARSVQKAVAGATHPPENDKGEKAQKSGESTAREAESGRFGASGR